MYVVYVCAYIHIHSYSILSIGLRGRMPQSVICSGNQYNTLWQYIALVDSDPLKSMRVKKILILTAIFYMAAFIGRYSIKTAAKKNVT